MGFSIGLLQLVVISALEQGAADSLPVAWIPSVEQHSSLLRADGVQGPRAPVPVLSLAALPNQAVAVLCCSVKWEFILSQDSEGFECASDPPQEPGSLQRTHTVFYCFIFICQGWFFSVTRPSVNSCFNPFPLALLIPSDCQNPDGYMRAWGKCLCVCGSGEGSGLW